MKIILAAAEVAPFAKVGGLADVTGSLPKVLKAAGNDVRLIIPFYGSIHQKFPEIKDVQNSVIKLQFGEKSIEVSLKETMLPGTDIIIYFVGNTEYFTSHNEIYPKKLKAKFEQERFLVFGRSVLELMEKINFQPDVIHCNDWHTANIPIYLKTLYKDSQFYNKTRVLFSIHNLAYQGLFSKDILEFANLDDLNLFTPDKLEFYNDVNWMKGGILYSDMVNTVSKTYAEEIQTEAYGEKLEGVLKDNAYKLHGILNGIDYSSWNPEFDDVIPAKYSFMNLSGKAVCKQQLQKELNLPINPNIPLIGLVSRFAEQKGLDLIEAISDELKHLNIQLAVLGSGEEEFEILFKDLTMTSKNIKAHIGFDAELAQRIYAGVDMFLMPSKFEPCGLGQIIALKYGTVPIVRETGGLADTVNNFSNENLSGNGFTFKDYSADKLLESINKAIKTYQDENLWKKVIFNAMTSDFSWNKSAQCYIDLYKKIIQ